jgi:hypothetical protein
MERIKRQRQKKEDWIAKDLKSKIPKLSRKIIYVPLQNELQF